MEPKLSIALGALRHAAEARLKATPASRAARLEVDLRRLRHELDVHQIELEMQNDELPRAQDQAAEVLGRYSELYDFAPVGCVSLGTDGTIVRLNLLGATWVGLERGHARACACRRAGTGSGRLGTSGKQALTAAINAFPAAKRRRFPSQTPPSIPATSDRNHNSPLST